MSDPTTVQTFLDQATLDRLVRDTLPPPDGEHSFVAVATVDKTGAGIVVGFDKVAGQWQIDADAYYRHEWTGSDALGAQVIFKR